MTRSSFVLALGLGAVLALGSCASPPPAPPPAPEPPGRDFSGQEAWTHLETLARLGSRAPGSPGAEEARAYLRSGLEALGLEVREDRELLEDRGDGLPLEMVNLVAILPGESSDLFVLAAPYDTQPPDDATDPEANAGSGAALLLELGRALTEEPLPYTVWLAFLGSEAPQGDLADEQALWSSRFLVRRMREEGSLERARLVVFFDRVADRDLAIARDLRSHRMYRDAFFAAAQQLGHSQAFPRDAGFDSVVTGHLSFGAAGVRRSVALKDPRHGVREPPAIPSQPEGEGLEQCSPESLEVVGRVAQRGLADIATLLTRVDRFARGRDLRPPEDAADGALPEGPSNLSPDVSGAPPESGDADAAGSQTGREPGSEG